MSRTDKQAPWNVKALYYGHWVEEYHDHRNGACELPPRPTVDNIGHYWRDQCGWTYSHWFKCEKMQRCGCSMCGRDAYLPMPRRRRERIDGRRYCRDGWKDEY